MENNKISENEYPENLKNNKSQTLYCEKLQITMGWLLASCMKELISRIAYEQK